MTHVYNNEGYSSDGDSCIGDRARAVLADVTKGLGGEKAIALNVTQKVGKRTRNIMVFASGNRGTTIRNACTGQKYVGDLVGSAAEYNYYKVGYSSSLIYDAVKDPVTCFFDNKKEYDTHMARVVETDGYKPAL